MPVKDPQRTIAEQAENEASVLAFALAFKLSALTEAEFAKAMSSGPYEFNEDQVHRYKGARHSSGRQTVIPSYALRRAALAVGRSVDELYAKATGQPTTEAERFRSLQAQVETVMPTMQRIQAMLDAAEVQPARRRPARRSELRAWVKDQAGQTAPATEAGPTPESSQEPPGAAEKPAEAGAGVLPAEESATA